MSLAAMMPLTSALPVQPVAPATMTLLPRDGEPTRIESIHEGRGLRHQADEVAHRLAAGDLESPLMGLDESIAIMQTMDAVQVQALRD